MGKLRFQESSGLIPEPCSRDKAQFYGLLVQEERHLAYWAG